ncbi:phosphotransferase family protein [Aquisediminimonas sediminicola]|uniref:phosphotransferase family protein n=1 Tax=Alteraquisediminimonas sediminicola TaxID=2676787 RepID=UPI001C8EF1D2
MQPLGADADARFAAWLGDVAGLDEARLGPLLTGGNANVTRLVESRQGKFVLRHPPVHAVSDKAAAGIAREFKVLTALHGRAPVPRPVAWCDDPTILGQPFAITEWLDGVALTTSLPPSYPQGVEAVNALGREMITGLAAVHRIDWQEVLPVDFGRPESFVSRQIDRWLEVRQQHAVRSLPLLDEIAVWLRANLPPVARASVIHCDFHLDNCLVSRLEPRLLAILDWEMATLGDPLIDLGLCLFFWRRDPTRALGFAQVQALSNHADVIAPAALADLWSQISGIDYGQLNYYRVFSAWRLAAIVEGAYVLYCQGKDESDYARGLEFDVPNLLREVAVNIDEGRL